MAAHKSKPSVPGAASRGEGVCLDLSDTRDLRTAQESKQQSTRQGWAASVGQGYSATRCQETLQELQPKGDMQTYQLVDITLLLLKVKKHQQLHQQPRWEGQKRHPTSKRIAYL